MNILFLSVFYPFAIPFFSYSFSVFSSEGDEKQRCRSGRSLRGCEYVMGVRVDLGYRDASASKNIDEMKQMKAVLP